MKKARNKLIAAALILSLGATPIIGCTTVPKANTNRSNGVVQVTAEAKTDERKSTTPVKPEAKPAPETKPSETAKPETKPMPEVKPGEPAKPDAKPILPTPTVKPEVKPEIKPTPPPVVKPEVKPETKPTPPPVVKPEVKPETKPTPPPTCKPCKPNKPCKGEKPSEGFMIDNFKIIQQALEKLGVKPSELETMIKEGKKLTDVLEVKNIPYNKFRKVLYKEYCAAIKEGVKNEQITKEEGKLLQAAIKQKVMCWMKDKK